MSCVDEQKLAVLNGENINQQWGKPMNKEKFTDVLNMLADKVKPTDIAETLHVSSRTVYEVIESCPLFFGRLLAESRDNLKKGRRRP